MTQHSAGGSKIHENQFSYRRKLKKEKWKTFKKNGVGSSINSLFTYLIKSLILESQLLK